MRRGWSGSGRWKWLRPGMGVKRWLVLLVAGLVLLALAVTNLPRLSDVWVFVERLHVLNADPLVEFILYGLAGAGLVMVAIFAINRTLVSAFRRSNQTEVADVVYRHRQRQRGPKVVAIGGGHGLNTLLRGLKEHTDNITAIVTVADDGGSSGRLRRELGMLPPGDFRNCLAALSDDEGLLSQLFQYRFADNTDLDGHSFGNLYLSAMTAVTGSFEAALAESSRVLAVRGRVMPSTLAQVTLAAEVMAPVAMGGNGRSALLHLRGESNIGHAEGRIQRVYLEPQDAPAYPQAIRAILDADMVVIGPGSLYTSVLPNLLVQDICAALESSTAIKVYVCNVATQAGETAGYDVTDHVEALTSHIGRGVFSVVLANGNIIHEQTLGGTGSAEWVLPPPGLPQGLPQGGASGQVDGYRLVLADLVDPQHPWRHDSAKLAQALMSLVSEIQ